MTARPAHSLTGWNFLGFGLLLIAIGWIPLALMLYLGLALFLGDSGPEASVYWAAFTLAAAAYALSPVLLAVWWLKARGNQKR